ncbi:MAG: zinc dependent phospholipase C family protein [Bacilli bacterium]|nr:zinc dependent phospholipase C family protein [Bacilli bacterium]
MPSSVTHNYFASDVYDKINIDIKKKLQFNLDDFKCFAQGPDPYFFYDFHLTKKSKNVFKINDAMQHTNVNEHFLSLINYINEKEYYSNSQVMAYLYGQICHFILDSTIHPFVIFNTGIYDDKDVNSYKYNGLHEEMEYFIDIHLIAKRENIVPKKYKVYKNIFNINPFNDELKDVINTVTKDVYNFNNVSDIYYKSINDMKKFYYIFNYDKYGIKKFIYKIMDLICKDRLVKKEELSFNVDPNSKLYYLNSEKDEWTHPCDINEKYNFSFFELYNIAIDKAILLIEEIDNMLKKKKINSKKIKMLFGNLNYGTGKDCDLNLEYKYFKF